jgi:hypothetical protein
MLIFITDMGYSGIFRDATSGGYSEMSEIIETLPPFVCRRAHVLFTLFVFACAK